MNSKRKKQNQNPYNYLADAPDWASFLKQSEKNAIKLNEKLQLTARKARSIRG